MEPDFKCTDLVIIRSTSINTSRQLKHLLDYKKLDQSNLIIFPYYGRFFSALSIILSLVFVFVYHRNVCFGYLPSRVCKTFLFFFRSARCLIYDDGVATLNYTLQDVFTKQPGLKIKTLFYKMFENEDKIIPHNIRFDGESYRKDNITPKFKGESIFVGTKVVDDGILDAAQYLHAVKSSIVSKGVKHYICHRDEGFLIIESIKSLGVNIVKLEVPIEIALASKEIAPESIYGLITTSLLTAKIMFDIPTFYYPVTVSDKALSKELKELEETFDRYGLIRL
jgi:hypothetical protein